MKTAHVIIEISEAWDMALDHAVFLLNQTHPEMSDEQLLAEILVAGISHTLSAGDRRRTITIDDIATQKGIMQ